MSRFRAWRRGRLWPLIRRMPRIKHLRGGWLHRKFGDRLFLDELWQPRRERLAAGVAIGIFVGMLPMPLQMLTATVLAFLARVNIPGAIIATWLSNPVTFAAMAWGQYYLGALLLGKIGSPPPGGFLEFLAKAPVPFLTGVIVSGILGALLAYPLTLWGWDLFHSKFSHKKPSLPDEAPPKDGP